MSMQYKHTFLHKVFYYRIASTRLLSEEFHSKFKMLGSKWKCGKYNVKETIFAGRSIVITVEVKESLMQYTIKTKLIYNSGIIKSNK